MSNIDDESDEFAPMPGDTILVVDNEGAWTGEDVTVKAVGDFDDKTGKYNVLGSDDQNYQIYWSDEDDEWVHQEEA